MYSIEDPSAVKLLCQTVICDGGFLSSVNAQPLGLSCFPHN